MDTTKSFLQSKTIYAVLVALLAFALRWAIAHGHLTTLDPQHAGDYLDSVLQALEVLGIGGAGLGRIVATRQLTLTGRPRAGMLLLLGLVAGVLGGLGALAGCAGTNADPYTLTDQGIKADDTAVVAATAGIKDALAIGIDPTKIAQFGQSFSLGEDGAILTLNTVIIPLEVRSAAPTLAPGAVTLALLQSDLGQLSADNRTLRVTADAAVPAVVRAILEGSPRLTRKVPPPPLP